jgi:class 3 adenylate cyclase
MRPGSNTRSGRAEKVTDRIATGTTTLLFAYIGGSTALHENYSDQMLAVLERHDETSRTDMEANGGYGFSTGRDAFRVAFNTARLGTLS